MKTNRSALLRGLENASNKTEEKERKKTGKKSLPKPPKTIEELLVNEGEELLGSDSSTKKVYSFTLSQEVGAILDALSRISEKNSKSQVVEKILKPLWT